MRMSTNAARRLVLGIFGILLVAFPLIAPGDQYHQTVLILILALVLVPMIWPL